jgi:hypothetical protein
MFIGVPENEAFEDLGAGPPPLDLSFLFCSKSVWLIYLLDILLLPAKEEDGRAENS